jgi:hypothetical protein
MVQKAEMWRQSILVDKNEASLIHIKRANALRVSISQVKKARPLPFNLFFLVEKFSQGEI